MSSRVQKGGPVFRPVTKARSRLSGSVSRHASAALDDAAQTAQMPPPTSLPPHVQQTQPPPLAIQPSATDCVDSLEDSTQVPPNHTAAGNEPSDRLHDRQTPSPPFVAAGPSLSFQAPPQTIGNLPPDNAKGPTPSRIVIGQNIRRAAKQAPLTMLLVRETLSDAGNVARPQGEPHKKGLSDTEIDKADVSSSDSPAEATGIGKTKRKRRRSSDNDGDSHVPKSRGTRGRRSRGPSLPLYDSNAHPGEDIDPTVVTMAALCNDTGQGRVSSKAAEILSNHAAWKVQNREKRARMKMLMEAKKYGRKDDEETDPGQDVGTSTETDHSNNAGPSRIAESSTLPTGPNQDAADFDYTQNLTTSRFNVQVRIGPNGETIIDEDSLVVNREETDETNNYTHVTESDHTKFVNSGTYGKRYRGSRWSADETELFYDALSQYGENYELIAYVLPGRDRKSCKNKFKVEDKKNHARINYCLNNRVPVDIKTLSRMTGKDFSGPVPEIRTPAPPSSMLHETAIPVDNPGSTLSDSAEPGAKKRRVKRLAPESEEGVVIIGNMDAAES